MFKNGPPNNFNMFSIYGKRNWPSGGHFGSKFQNEATCINGSLKTMFMHDHIIIFKASRSDRGLVHHNKVQIPPYGSHFGSNFT